MQHVRAPRPGGSILHQCALPAPTPTVATGSRFTWCWTTTPPTSDPRSEPGWRPRPLFRFHFTPTLASWLNLVEIWFGIIERQAIRSGTFCSVSELVTAIRTFINDWNPRAHPFLWTKPASEVLNSINKKLKHISTTSH